MTTFKMKTTSDVISVRKWVKPKKKNSVKRTLHIFSKLCETFQNCMVNLFNFERNWWIGPFVEDFEAISRASSFGVGVKCSWRLCTYCFMLSECNKDLSQLAIWNLHLAILHYLQRYHKERTKKMRMIFSINYKSRFLRRSTRLINLTVQRVSTARKGIAGMHIFWCHKYKHYILREFVKLSIRHEQTDFGQYNEI